METFTSRGPSTGATRARPTRPEGSNDADASIIVNRRLEIVSFSGPVARFLTRGDPRPGSALTTLLPAYLVAEVVDAMRHAQNQRVERRMVMNWRDGAAMTLHVRLADAGEEGALLLGFCEDDPDGDVAVSERKAAIDAELDVADVGPLEAAIANLELVNRELVIANRAATADGEAALRRVDELHGANEELRALNGRLLETAERFAGEARDLREILDSAAVATLALDADFNIRFFTPPATALFGLIASDIGRPLADLAPRVVDERLADDARDALASLVVKTCEVPSRDGAWFLRRVAPRRGGGGDARGVVITFSALPQIKNAERAAASSNAFLESILETVRRPMLTFDRSLAVSFVNRACHDLFKAGDEEFLGRRLADTPARPIAAFVEEMLWPRDGAFGDLENHRLEIETSDGGRLVLLATLRTIEASSEGAFLVALEDVTEKERVEQSLAAVARGLEQTNRLKSQFLAAASHDLRQPLQTMCLLSAILRRKLTGRALQLSTKFDETIEAMNGVVNAILDINQLEAGAIAPAIQSFPADLLLNKLFSEFDTVVQSKGLTLRFVGCAATIKSDPRLLLQILRNLVNNAVKFTASGKILIGCRRRGGAIDIEVLDSGYGIRSSEIEDIFEFFHKGRDNPRESDDGLGLGLAIVQHLASMLDHEVNVSSRFGQGSRFSVRVPLSDEAATIMVKPSRAIPPLLSAQAICILIVEDEPSVRESLQMLLESEGHVVNAAASGPAALSLVETGVCAPDLVIVDYSVPGGMSGLDTIDALRGALNRAVPAIALSGDISLATVAKIKAKADVHMRKPVQADDLLDAVQTLRASLVRQTAGSCLVGAGPPRLARPEPDRRAGSLYIVDDDENVRNSLRDLLESYGYATRQLASGRDIVGLPLCNEDCLILDAGLPDMDGFEILAHFKMAPAHPSIILITGRGDVDTAVRAMREGACDFLEKPFSPAQLLESVTRARAGAPHESDDTQQDARAQIERLTPRQRAVLDLIVKGRANKVIANDLGIGQRTVESHRAMLMKKLGVRTFAELIRLAIAAR